MHTLRLEHPFERTQGKDTKLIKESNNHFVTTPFTDKNIKFNIINYPMIYIDGEKLSEAWKTRSPNLLTKDQLNFIIKEIDLQQRGYGVRPEYNKTGEKLNEIYFKYNWPSLLFFKYSRY